MIKSYVHYCYFTGTGWRLWILYRVDNTFAKIGIWSEYGLSLGIKNPTGNTLFFIGGNGINPIRQTPFFQQWDWGVSTHPQGKISKLAVFINSYAQNKLHTFKSLALNLWIWQLFKVRPPAWWISNIRISMKGNCRPYFFDRLPQIDRGT